jgi:hypothetical protein
MDLDQVMLESLLSRSSNRGCAFPAESVLLRLDSLCPPFQSILITKNDEVMNPYPPTPRAQGRVCVWKPPLARLATRHGPGRPAAPKQRALPRRAPHRSATPIQSASPTQHRAKRSPSPAASGGTAGDRRPVSTSVSTSLCVAAIRPFTRFSPGIVTQNCPFSALKTETVFVRTLPINGLRGCQSKPGQLCGDIPEKRPSRPLLFPGSHLRAPTRTYAHLRAPTRTNFTFQPDCSLTSKLKTNRS